MDFTRLSTKFGLSKQALSGISAFRKRNEDARKTLQSLKSQKTEVHQPQKGAIMRTTYTDPADWQVDFSHYKSLLKNGDVVAQLEKAYTSYKPVDYDLSAQLKTIDAFEEKAVSPILISVQSVY